MRCIEGVLLISEVAAIVAVIEDQWHLKKWVAWMVDPFKKECKYNISNYMLASYDIDI